METLFGADFSDIRVHVGQEASSIGAVAFTFGSSVYFAHGHYNPHSPQGQRLLAHELTHVLQQKAGRVRNPFGSGVAIVQDSALEAEAERMGLRASVAPAAPQAVQPRMTAPGVPRSRVAPPPALQPRVARPPVLQPRIAPPPVPQPRVTAPRPSGNSILQPFVAPPFWVSVIQSSSKEEDYGELVGEEQEEHTRSEEQQEPVVPKKKKKRRKNKKKFTQTTVEGGAKEKRKREVSPVRTSKEEEKVSSSEKKKKRDWPESLDLLGKTYVKSTNQNKEIFYQLPTRVKNNDQYITIHKPGKSREAWTGEFHAKAVGGGKTQVSYPFSQGKSGEPNESGSRKNKFPELRSRASNLGKAFWEAIQ